MDSQQLLLPTHFLGIDVALGRLDFGLLRESENERWTLACRPGVATDAETLLAQIGGIAPPQRILAGIDAPLSLPAEGAWRECERMLHRAGIACYAPLGGAFARVKYFGIATAERLRRAGITCVEVYPYATRRRLEIAPRCKKQTPEGRQAIREALCRFIDHLAELPEHASHDALDAILAALTVALAARGKCERLAGRDGEILLPLTATRPSPLSPPDCAARPR